MGRSPFAIACLPMFNSYGLLDRVLTGDGRDSRSFRSVLGLKGALATAGIESEELQGWLSDLEAGISFEVRATEAQRATFFAYIEPEDSRVPAYTVH